MYCRALLGALVGVAAVASFTGCKREPPPSPPWPPTRGAVEVSKGLEAASVRFEKGRIVGVECQPERACSAIKDEVTKLTAAGELRVKTHDPEAEAQIGINAGPGDDRYMQAVYVTLIERGYVASLKPEAEP